MRFEEWQPYYRAILADFGYDEAEDARVARRLDALLHGERVGEDALGSLLRGRDATVLGNGPGLAKEVGDARGTVLAADEATSVAMAHGVRPDIITTDLDGRVEDQLEANRRGTIVLILGHGDNGAAVERWAPRFRGPVMAMTQGEPSGRMHNFGGFTDGDRAVFTAHHFGARSIRLLGFDFERPSPKDVSQETKLRKLRWARKLLQGLGYV